MDFDTVISLSRLVNATHTHTRVSFSLDQGEHVTEGVVRHFTRDTDGTFPRLTDGTLDLYLRISATMEHFLPVRDVIQLMHSGMLYLHDEN